VLVAAQEACVVVVEAQPPRRRCQAVEVIAVAGVPGSVLVGEAGEAHGVSSQCEGDHVGAAPFQFVVDPAWRWAAGFLVEEAVDGYCVARTVRSEKHRESVRLAALFRSMYV
jgi:hypothetical protein